MDWTLSWDFRFLPQGGELSCPLGSALSCGECHSGSPAPNSRPSGAWCGPECASVGVCLIMGVEVLWFHDLATWSSP